MFTASKKAEVAFDDEDPREVWFPATVLKQCDDHTFQVEYQQPGSGDEAVLHKANVDFWHIRPSPPHLSYTFFDLHQKVDVYYDYGWWSGVITKELADNRYNVFFKHSKKERESIFSKLRPHLEWKDRGLWYYNGGNINLFKRTFCMCAVGKKAEVAFDDEDPHKRTAFCMCAVGKKVEVAFDDEDPHEVWFPATVLKYSLTDTFQVEYQQPGSGDEAVLHKATVGFWNIRPSPPHLRDKDFGLDDEVDAYYDFGWWCGTITKELPDNMYSVLFEHSNKEREFICSKLRPHLEWENGEWYNKGVNIFQEEGKAANENTSSHLDEGKTKTKQSVEKDATKDLAGLQCNEMTVSQEKIINKSSTEIVQNVAEGDTEQLDAPLEQLTVVDKRGKRGKGIEQAPAMESSKKKGRLANEPKSLNIDKGATDDSVKIRSQEIMEKDITKDMALPVVMGLQCNEMTVTQGKTIQKSSTEISPSVAEGDTNQLDVLSVASTVVVKEGKEEDAATVAPKRKRGRPPKLQPKSPETPVTVDHQNGGVGPAEISVVEGAQVMEVSSTTSPGIKQLEKSQEPVKEPNEISVKEPNENPEQDACAQRGNKKYSSAKGRRVKRRRISVNESLAQDIQDASKEKTNGSLETKNPEASAVQSVDLDDQPLSTWIEGVHSPVPFNDPVGTSTSERQLEIVAGDIDADIPFVKTTALWHTIESMEAFRKLPQKPHFRPLLKGVKESAREGLAIGTMVTFSTVVDRTYCLRFDDPRSAIEDSLETLVDLESNGFDVEVLRERLTRLLLIKDKQEELEDRSKAFVEKREEQKIQEKTINDEVDEIDRQIRQVEEKRRKVLLKKEQWNADVDAMKAYEGAIEQELLEVAAEFHRLAAAPF